MITLVFPARAGMIPYSPLLQKAGVSIPRESGDDPVTVDPESIVGKYSPRERG